MRIPRLIYAAALAALAATIILPGWSFGESPRAQRLLKQANQIVLDAEKTKGERPQNEQFKEAIGAYQKVLKRDGETAEGAQAQLAIAKIRAGVPSQVSPRPGHDFPIEVFDTKQQNLHSSKDTLNQIFQKFNHKASYQELVDEYGEEDARKIQSILEQATVLEGKVSERVDSRNRGKLLYKIMDGLVAVTGRRPSFSYWFAIILLTVIVKIIITPLTKAQFKSMKEMQRLQPKVKEVQEKYKGDQREMGAKVMELYKEHGVNPLSGCLPLLIQMPILILVYTAIRYYEIQFARGTFLWIGWEDIVHRFALPIMGRPVWVTAENLAQPDLILLVLYTASMVISQKISIVDPTQAEQQKMMAIMMPVMFFFFIGYLPSAFVLYWFIFNLLQTWQQYHVIHGGGAGPGAGTAAGPAVTPPTPAPSPGPSRRSGRRRRRR
ncbi:MAG: membrane protein insertase YidC [Armatimonadetes bacterium]|nr:membrane protein insertase YidC [Armatimonadota bacterium]